MTLVCPACGRAALRVAEGIEILRDSRSDEITLQVVECTSCEFQGIAVYEESRRGGLGDESVDHRAYHVPREQAAHLRETLASCPKPSDPRCQCAAHADLGSRDARGRWSGLQGFDLGVFPSRGAGRWRSRGRRQSAETVLTGDPGARFRQGATGAAVRLSVDGDQAVTHGTRCPAHMGMGAPEPVSDVVSPLPAVRVVEKGEIVRVSVIEAWTEAQEGGLISPSQEGHSLHAGDPTAVDPL